MQIKISVKTMHEMGRLCYELGSRHISAEIHENCVKCPYDYGLFMSLKTLGFEAEKTGEENAENVSFTKVNSVTVTSHSTTFSTNTEVK